MYSEFMESVAIACDKARAMEIAVTTSNQMVEATTQQNQKLRASLEEAVSELHKLNDEIDRVNGTYEMWSQLSAKKNQRIQELQAEINDLKTKTDPRILDMEEKVDGAFWGGFLAGILIGSITGVVSSFIIKFI